jgi:hypothetical protein
MRKIFLVAERLAWEEKGVSIRERDQNEQLNWEVNHELGILDPFVEDPEQVPGGKNSQSNKWYPYQNEFEMKQALNFIFVAEDITPVTWSLWIGLQMNLQKMFEDEEGTVDPPGLEAHRSPDVKTLHGPRMSSQDSKNVMRIDLTDDHAPSYMPTLSPTFGIPTPPSSFTNLLDKTPKSPVRKRKENVFSSQSAAAPSPLSTPLSPAPEANPIKSMKITSYKTLQDFYCLLDQIERTSYVGALFLGAYAEHLHTDMCRDCWLKRNLALDDDDAEEGEED